MKRIAVVIAALMISSAAFANYVYRDGTGTLQTIFSFVCQTSVICPGQVPMDSTGTEKATLSNPLVTNQGGSNGADFSANAAAIPATASAVVLATIPATPSRALVEVQNQSGTTIQIVRDDGTGNNQTSLFLVGPNSGWRSQTFKGRLTIYGISGSEVAAYQD